jgi:hypothetical protein
MIEVFGNVLSSGWLAAITAKFGTSHHRLIARAALSRDEGQAAIVAKPCISGLRSAAVRTVLSFCRRQFHLLWHAIIESFITAML